jgi:hypothetical protein
VIFLCALLLFVDVSLLCTLVVHYHHIVVCSSWCSLMSPSAMLHALVVHQHLLVACSCCLSVSPYCAILMLIGGFLLCALVAHQCIVAMHSCCSSTSCCYALLLFIGISLCAFFMLVDNSLLLTSLLIDASSPCTSLTP